MVKPEIHEARTKGMQIQYALIGEFVCAFESVCAEMRTAIMFLGGRTGMSDQSFVQAITTELTAMPLLRAFRSVAIEKCSDPFETQVLDIICKRFDALISKRNTILHGTWYINYASEDQTDFSVGNGHKLKNTKSGVVTESQHVSEEDFRPLIDEGWDVAELVKRLALMKLTQAAGPSEGDFRKNFDVTAGVLSVPAHLRANR